MYIHLNNSLLFDGHISTLNTYKNDHDRNDRDRNDRDQNDQTLLPTQITATVMSPTLMTATKMTGHDSHLIISFFQKLKYPDIQSNYNS